MKRPWPTKQRIAGRHGHLSNEQMRELLEAVASPRWQQVFFIHLSADCNSAAAIDSALVGLRARLNCQFNIVASGGGTEVCHL
jgi:phosphoribosyl 1,2-cyclic phosphodiesterase